MNSLFRLLVDWVGRGAGFGTFRIFTLCLALQMLLALIGYCAHDRAGAVIGLVVATVLLVAAPAVFVCAVLWVEITRLQRANPKRKPSRRALSQ